MLGMNGALSSLDLATGATTVSFETHGAVGLSSPLVVGTTPTSCRGSSALYATDASREAARWLAVTLTIRGARGRHVREPSRRRFVAGRRGQ